MSNKSNITNIAQSNFPSKYRPPYPYTSSLRNLVSPKNKPLNGFTIYRRAYYNIIKQNGCNLKRNKVSFNAFRLWRQEPINVKSHYCNLARTVRLKFDNRQNIVNDRQTASSAQPNPTLPQSNDNSSSTYIDLEELAELASQMIEGIPTSVFDISPTF